MKIYILLVIALFGLNPLFSQELIVDSGVVLKKGIYRNFEEFRSNSPSLEYSTEVESMVLKSGILGYGESVTYYGIDTKIVKKFKSHEVFGFCDGENVYIYSLNYISKEMCFVELDYLGRYCYFEKIVPPYINNSPKKMEMILDINDGQYYDVDKKTLELLFAMNDPLTEQLEGIKATDSNYKELLIKYSEIHRDKILRVLPDKTRLDHLIYKKSSDSTLLDYESRMLSYISDPMILEMKVVKNYFGNDQLKVFGVWAKHENGNNTDYPYDIGTWYHYHKNGLLKEEINYNLLGQKNGRNVKYDDQGKIIKELMYIDGELVE